MRYWSMMLVVGGDAHRILVCGFRSHCVGACGCLGVVLGQSGIVSFGAALRVPAVRFATFSEFGV